METLLTILPIFMVIAAVILATVALLIWATRADARKLDEQIQLENFRRAMGRWQ